MSEVGGGRSFDVVVVGAGLVGAAIGYGLAARGLRVAVLDEDDDTYRASRGNFGLVWVQGKGVGRPEYAVWSQASSERWLDLERELGEEAGVSPRYERPGGVIVATSDEELENLAAMLSGLKRAVGNRPYDFEILDHAALAERVPVIGPNVVGGSYSPYDGHVNPLKLLRALHAGLGRHGAACLTGHRVDGVEPLAGGGFRLRIAGDVLECEKLVIAAGHGSKALGAEVGLDVPVYPEHGQILVTERVAPVLDHPMLGLRQTDEGSILIGASQEDRGFDLTARAKTSRDIALQNLRAYPFLDRLRIVRTWAALRVMTPDGFPIYDQSKEFPGAFVATCHSGVTLAANHARVVTDWIVTGEIPADMACFSTERFDVSQAA